MVFLHLATSCKMHSLNCILELLSCAVRKWMFVCTVVGQCAAVKAARSVSAGTAAASLPTVRAQSSGPAAGQC